jgi:hypothetical protein
MYKRALPIYIAATMATCSLVACSPPKQQLIAQCRSAALSEGRGRSLDPSDIGELTEACMMTKGYALKEDGPSCTDDAATAINPSCYYRNSLFGRLVARFSKD